MVSKFYLLSFIQTFDKLNDDFNYIFLIATTLAVIIATFVLSSLAKDSKVFKLMHKWKKCKIEIIILKPHKYHTYIYT